MFLISFPPLNLSASRPRETVSGPDTRPAARRTLDFVCRFGRFFGARRTTDQWR